MTDTAWLRADAGCECCVCVSLGSEPAPVEPPASAAGSKKFSFSMEMEGSKYKKYDSQFKEGSGKSAACVFTLVRYMA